MLPTLNSIVVRQDDSNILRYWEVAGTAHADRYSLQEGRTDTGVDPRFAAVDLLDNVAGFIECDSPVNSGPMHYVFAAAINHLNRWASGGDAPPMGDPLVVAAGDTDFVLDNFRQRRGWHKNLLCRCAICDSIWPWSNRWQFLCSFWYN